MKPLRIHALRRSVTAMLHRALTGSTPRGLAQLERRGQLRQATTDLLELRRIAIPPGATPPSRIVRDGRAEGVAWSTADDEELFATGEIWDLPR
jgi:hypothetical protein